MEHQRGVGTLILELGLAYSSLSTAWDGDALPCIMARTRASAVGRRRSNALAFSSCVIVARGAPAKAKARAKSSKSTRRKDAMGISIPSCPTRKASAKKMRRRRSALSVLGLLLHAHTHTHAYNPYLDRLHQAAGDHSTSAIQPTRNPDELLSSIDNVLLQSKLLLEKSEIVKRIDADHARDAAACSSLSAEVHPSTPNRIDYEWIHVQREGKQYPIAIRTMGTNPLLDAASIQQIRSAAERQWNDPSSSGGTSRFTYQRKGNYEAHLDDLAREDLSIQAIADKLLLSKVYPLIRDAFDSLVVDNMNSLQFCVYDSLIIRYNATEASSGLDPDIVVGAGQPLHRDLGLISVNIMLNSNDDFSGGGTAFENQFSDDDVDSQAPLKPVGPGHALSHLSSERHAGASTMEGVRDILVMFITATNGGPLMRPSAPALERCARLKATARGESSRFENALDAALCRAIYQRLAIDAVRGDGEAWHFLGMALRDFPLGQTPDDASVVEQLSLDCLLHAEELTPCDARLYNNLGLLLGQVYMKRKNQVFFDQARQCYEKSALLHRNSQVAGCDIQNEFDASILNYGLFLANLDRFREAADVLASASDVNDFVKTKGGASHALTDSEASHLRILQDADALRLFCETKC